MRSRLPLLILGFAACGSPPKLQMKLPERHAALGNGMRVILLPDASTQLVEVDVRYDVGAREDPPGKAGLAHLVEHLMFQQRQAGPDKPAMMAILGQDTIYFNAFTTWDTTHYQEMARAEQLDSLIGLEAARLYTGCKTIPEDQFEREREVVRNEMRMRLGSPDAQIEYTLLKDIYPEGHPYHEEVGGDDKSVASITLDDACKFMESYYVPERATMVIAGNVDEVKAKASIGNYLAALPAKPGAPRIPVPPLTLTKKTVEEKMNVEEPQLYVAFQLPATFTDEGQAAEDAFSVMAGEVSSAGNEYGFATGVTVQPLGGELEPVFALQINLTDESKANEALDWVWKSAKMAHRAFEGKKTDADAQEEQTREIGDLALMFEPLQARTLLFADMAQFQPNGNYFMGMIQRIKNMSGDFERKIAEQVLDPDHAVVIVVKRDKSQDTTYKRSDVKFTPGAGSGEASSEDFPVDPADAQKAVDIPEHASALGNAQKFTLGNGMKVILVPTDSMLPIVTAQLVFDVGSAREPASESGLAQIAAGALRPPAVADVTGEMSSAFGMFGIEFGGYASADSTTFQAKGLDIYLEPMIKGLERTIIVGEYSQEAIENYQKHFAYRMKRKAAAANLVFQRELNRAVYGDDHPYGKTGVMTKSTLDKIGRDDLMSWKSKHFTAKNATLVVAGKFDPKKAEEYIRDNFGSWSSGDTDKPVTEKAEAKTAPTYVGVAGEDAPEIELGIAYPSANGRDPLYPARVVLGEMLNSRVWKMRTTLGSTYGLYAGYGAHLGPGMYQIGGPVDADRAGETLIAIRAELDKLRNGDGFDEDFVRARKKILQQLIARDGESASLAGVIAQLSVFGLDTNEADTLIQKIATLRPIDVKAVLQAELRPQLETIVAVGPEAKVQKMFQDAGLTAKMIKP